MRAAIALRRAFRGRLPALLLISWACPAGAQVIDVAVGVTPTCPYGLSACWPAASEALARLDGVESVAPAPDAFNSTAYLTLKHRGLPDLGKWPGQFKAVVGEVFAFRGVEVTVRAEVREEDGRLVLRAPGLTEVVTLAPLEHKLQWNFRKASARQPEPDEQDAHRQLVAGKHAAAPGPLAVEVTGPLRESGRGLVLEVREFFILPRTTGPR